MEVQGNNSRSQSFDPSQDEAAIVRLDGLHPNGQLRNKAGDIEVGTVAGNVLEEVLSKWDGVPEMVISISCVIEREPK